MDNGGGGGPLETGGLAGSEKAGSDSFLGNDEVGCNVRGDGCFSPPASENGRVGVDVENGEGRLWAADMDEGPAEGKGGGFWPITSLIEGKDCRWGGGSLSSEVLRDSTGEIMPGMLDGGPE